MRNGEINASGKNYFFEIIKALIVALILTMLLVLASALIIKLFNIPSSYISVFNQVIKGVAIFVSALVSLKLPVGGYARGIILGVLYIALAFVVFSLFNGSFTFSMSLLNDIALGAVTGLVSGIIAVNLRK